MKNEFKSTIFNPRTGIDFRLNSARLIYGSLGFMLLYLALTQLLQTNSETDKAVFISLFLLIIVGARWSYNEKQKKFGYLTGELKITEQIISIDKKEFNWQEISNFSFDIQQVLDEPLWEDDTWGAYRFYGGPSFSQGVDNYIEFDSPIGHIRTYFQLATPSQRVDLVNLLRRHFFLGNIELQRTYNGLHLEYEQIQELKKEKAEWVNLKSS